jgi:hypothetical protein
MFLTISNNVATSNGSRLPPRRTQLTFGQIFLLFETETKTHLNAAYAFLIASLNLDKPQLLAFLVELDT